MTAREDHERRVRYGVSEELCWRALFDEIDRRREIKKSDDGAYEHVVEIYHAAAEELTIALAHVASLQLELDLARNDALVASDQVTCDEDCVHAPCCVRWTP